MKNIRKKFIKTAFSYLIVVLEKLISILSLVAVIALFITYTYNFNYLTVAVQLGGIIMMVMSWKASEADNSKFEKKLFAFQNELKNTDLSLLSPKNLANNNKPEKVEKTKEIKLTKKEPKKEATKPDEKPKTVEKKEGVVNA